MRIGMLLRHCGRAFTLHPLDLRSLRHALPAAGRDAPRSSMRCAPGASDAPTLPGPLEAFTLRFSGDLHLRVPLFFPRCGA
jgi:hypothetical protein